MVRTSENDVDAVAVANAIVTANVWLTSNVRITISSSIAKHLFS